MILATVSCFCGYAVPAPVNDLAIAASADNMSATITWTAPTEGAGSGYFDPSELVYIIYYVDQDAQKYIALDETTELTYTTDPIESTTLQGYTYAVTAYNLGGESDMVSKTVVLGTPYTAPFIENLTDGTISTQPWNISTTAYTTAAIISDGSELGVDVTSDDGGMFVIFDNSSVSGGSTTLQVPKMTLKDLNAPILTFAMFHYDDEGSLSVSVSTDEQNYTELFNKNLRDDQGWVEYEIDLSAYKSVPWTSINFTGTVTDLSCIFIDYIRVENSWERNASINKLEAPSKLAAGEERTFNVKVVNKGTEPVVPEVYFSIDGSQISTDILDEALVKGESATVTFKYTPTVEQIGKTIEAQVEVRISGTEDQDPNDNTASATVLVTQPLLPVITDLTGTADAALQNINLTWTEPEILPLATLDDIESYEPFATEALGEYVLIDGDGLEKTYTITNTSFPHAGEAMSFIVWTPSEIGLTTQNFMPYSGDKCLVSFASVPSSGQGNDDWLISPEIVGGTELSFFAMSADTSYPEEFEVLYSTTTQDRGAFVVLSTETEETGSWTKFTYTLPSDAKYFAIRNIGYDKFALLIDDLSYVKASTSTITLMGYNVYLNGTCITESPIAETSYNYTSDSPASELTFNVTAVYDEGESLMSNTMTFSSVSANISGTKIPDVKVYGVKGAIRIESSEEHAISIYSIDGRLLHLLESVDSHIDIPANPGIYVVNVDNKATKIQVK